MFRISCIILLLFFTQTTITISAQQVKPVFQYVVSAPRSAEHYFHVVLKYNAGNEDSVEFKMPRWTPGYYQMLNYGTAVENLSAKDDKGNKLSILYGNDNTWKLGNIRNKVINIAYDVKAEKQFVAQSYVDADRAYIVPGSVFLYVPGKLNQPLTIKLIPNTGWNKVAAGLSLINKNQFELTSPDFDVLYDSPILLGKLEELPSFNINGIQHRFIGYNLGNFDKELFMNKLKKVVEAAVNIIGDIPYEQYTFIGIGPGRGGIEHLNSTSVSFNGDGLNKPEEMNRMLNFLAHEYFHHYNVKRIRPFELGPFDYDKENRTNLLWVSEGLSVYYEYLIVKRAGLSDEATLFSNFEHSINAFENSPGKKYQSLTQASYETWNDGPFGKQGADADKSISYYDKGPVVGLVLDFAIRNATQNRKSLDDVMRYLYQYYYKEKKRGFTDAEFQQTCEAIAGISLKDEFEYVYTTKELDYNKYLGYAGLKLETQTNDIKKQFVIKHFDSPGILQSTIFNSWLR